jgi:hypothetical protein
MIFNLRGNAYIFFLLLMQGEPVPGQLVRRKLTLPEGTVQ